jgi:hypothetical protein
MILTVLLSPTGLLRPVVAVFKDLDGEAGLQSGLPLPAFGVYKPSLDRNLNKNVAV